MTSLQYFETFFLNDFVDKIVEKSDLYSVQRDSKSVDTNAKEIKTFIGMKILMGIVKLPQYLDTWSNTLRYPAVADVMPRNWFSELRQNLHFVDNNYEHDQNDKLFKTRPINKAVRNECVITRTVSEC